LGVFFLNFCWVYLMKNNKDDDEDKERDEEEDEGK
jgi:hypothetical protein